MTEPDTASLNPSIEYLRELMQDRARLTAENAELRRQLETAKSVAARECLQCPVSHDLATQLSEYKADAERMSEVRAIIDKYSRGECSSELVALGLIGNIAIASNTTDTEL